MNTGYRRSDFYSKTVEIEPLPPPNPWERLMFHVENAARYAHDCGPEMVDAISNILKRKI
jgi:hypothetical protein